MKTATVAALALIASATFSHAGPVLGAVRPVALVGGTLVDVRDYGHSLHDVRDAVVILRGDRIASAGPRSSVVIPAGARIVNCSGKYILPGLVDGFAGLNSQAQANATLYMGVTTVVGSGDDRRGILKLDAHPSPHVYPLDSAGTTDDYSLLIHLPKWSRTLKDGPTSPELARDVTNAQLGETARRGTRVIWVGHNLTAGNVKFIIARSRQLHMITYGEFISTPYRVAFADGVDSLLHMTRYELGMIPDRLLQPLIKDPEGKAQGPAYAYLQRLSASDPRVLAYAREIVKWNVALMPTFSLEYLELFPHRNLWKEPAAAILDPKGLHLPPNRITGEAEFRSAAARKRDLDYVAKFWAINRAIAKSHPLYLAASGASAVGTMPGISMHTELELLVRLGLTPREALAAATSNYSAKFGWHELGLIAPGRRADVLVLDADPTVAITNTRRIAAVIESGRLIDRPALLRRH